MAANTKSHECTAHRAIFHVNTLSIQFIATTSTKAITDKYVGVRYIIDWRPCAAALIAQ